MYGTTGQARLDVEKILRILPGAKGFTSLLLSGQGMETPQSSTLSGD